MRIDRPPNVGVVSFAVGRQLLDDLPALAPVLADGPSGFTVGAAAPYLRSDADEMSSSCGNTALIGVDLSLYGHRHWLYHRRTATEDRAPVGTDPSAVAAPNGTGGIACGFPGDIA